MVFLKPESDLNSLSERLKFNKDRLEGSRETPLANAKPTKNLPGVYMIFFEEKLQYIGSSGNLFTRIRNDLINGNRESHTLINKLCFLRGLETKDAVNWLKQNSRIKFIAIDSEEDARLLEDAMIALKHPYFNTPLRRFQKEFPERNFKEEITTTHRLDEWAGTDKNHAVKTKKQ
ncbi:MAG: hypothetical protein QG670_2708 [Thermoproteota archaeon]|nr:hypothetical protein [Thermoproteota archaeon]